MRQQKLMIQTLQYQFPMNNDSKCGLRNASNILNKIRRKYLKNEPQESQLLPHNKTFVQQQSLELYEQKTTPRKKDIEGNKHEEIAHMSSVKKYRQSIQPQKLSFCEKLILKNLEETLKVFEGDLQILEENKKDLQEGIQFLGERIRKLRQLQDSSTLLEVQNKKLKDFLQKIIEQYHQSNRLVFRSQLSQQQSFNSLRSKIRLVIKQMEEDIRYVGFIQYWNSHVDRCLTDALSIQQQIKRTELDRIKAEQQKRRREEFQKEDNQTGKIKVQKVFPERRENDEDQFPLPDQPRQKKRLSETEKASLLGDLKSFAKSFKFPSK